MQGWLEPRGPLGPRVYWARRAVVAAVVLALVVVLGWLFSRGSSGEVITATPSPTPVPSASTSEPAPQNSPSPEPTEQPAEEPTGAESSDAASDSEPTDALSVPVVTEPPPPPTCTAEMLTATISGTEDLKVTDPQTFTVSVVSRTACALDLTGIGAKVEVTSGTDAIWSTASCPQWAPTGSWDLVADEPITFDVGWPTRRGRECELSEDLLLPGTYVATVTVGDTGKFVMRLAA